MKVLSILLLAFVAHSVSLNWTQSGSPNLAYNTVGCGKTSGGPYTLFVHVSATPITSFSKTPVPKGTYYCTVTATDASKRLSKVSNEVKIVVP